MKVLWLRDGKAGHRNKAKGLLRALGQLTDIDTAEYDLEWRLPIIRHLLMRLSSNGLSLPVYWFFKGMPDISGVDLILSSGGATQWPNAALAHQYCLKNVFLGSIRKMPASAFDLVASHDPQFDERPFFQFDLIPSLVSPDLAKGAAKEAVGLHSKDWGLLIGGDGEGLKWSSCDFDRMVERFLEQAAQSDVRVWVATSRRTPPEVETRVMERFEESGLLRGACWFHCKKTLSLSLLTMYGACRYLVVSADSMSMIHEAVSSGNRTIATFPSGATLNNRSLVNQLKLESLGYVHRQDLNSFVIANSTPPGGWKEFDCDPALPLAREVLAVLD